MIVEPATDVTRLSRGDKWSCPAIKASLTGTVNPDEWRGISQSHDSTLLQIGFEAIMRLPRFGSSASRFRSADRDTKSDTARIGAIEQALRKAIGEAESEKSGLEKRIADAKSQLAGLMGNVAFEYQDREAGDEEKLVAAEKRLITAEQRTRALTTHLGHLKRVLQTLEQQ
jgi:hypothetical protein